VIDGTDVPARNHQHVRWRLRIDVAEGKDVIGLVDDIRRDLAVRHLAEQAVRHGLLPCQRKSMRPLKACDSVPAATYSSSPPSGTPCAMRVTRMSRSRASSPM